MNIEHTGPDSENRRHINDLPPETLANIFILCTLTNTSTRSTRRLELPKESLNRCTNFTHVCRHWRAVALDAPFIWCRPEFSLPGLAAEMLERSGSVPLDLALDPEYTSRDSRFKNHRVMGLLKGVLADLARIRSLEIRWTGESDHWVMDFLSNMGRPAPHLSSLTMFYEYTRSNEHPFRAISLNGHYPHLERLTMSGCDIGTLSLRSMRSIKLFRVRSARGNVPPASQLLRQLDYIRPNLRVLELARCWGHNSTSPSLSLSFPCLCLLIISSTFVGVTSLVPYLTIPTTTTVRITTYGISDSDFHVLVSWVAQCFSGSSSKKRRMEHLELSVRETELAGIMLSTWPDSGGERHERGSSQFSLNLRFEDPITSQESRIGRLLSVLPVAELQRLTYCFPSDEPRSLLRYFQALPNLHTIQPVGGDFFEQTLGVLTENRDAGQSSLSPYISDVFVTFPALRRIVLKSVDFPVGTDTFWHWQPNLWPEQFVEALRVRSERGAPLPAVVLKHCVGVDTRHLEELRGSNIEVSVVNES